MESDKLESCLYDARKRKTICSNRLCSGKYSVFGLNLSPLSWDREHRGSCPGPCAPQDPGPEGIFPEEGFPKGAFLGFSKGLVPAMARFVARGLFSSVCPDGLVPGGGEPGMPPARTQPDNCTIWIAGSIGTPGKGRDRARQPGKGDHRGQYPGPLRSCQGVWAPGEQTLDTDWQHRQGRQARCRFEGRDAPVVRPVARTSSKLLATRHGIGLTECSRDCRTAGTLVSIEAGSGTEGHDARQQCRRQLLRSFGVETASFLVASPLPLFSQGKGRIALFTMQSRHRSCALVCCTADVPRRVCPYPWLCIVLWCWQDVSLVWMPGTVQEVLAGRESLWGDLLATCVSCAGI